MAQNTYFLLTTTTLGAKRFRAVYDEESVPRGTQKLRIVEPAVTGAMISTQAPQAQRTNSINVKFTGNETGDYGTYANLVSYFTSNEAITFTDWNDATSYAVFFINPTLDPAWWTPMQTLGPGKVLIQLIEATT